MPFASKSAIQSRGDHLGICIIRNFRVPHKNPGIKATPTLEAQIFELISKTFDVQTKYKPWQFWGQEVRGPLGEGFIHDEKSIHDNKINSIIIIFD